VFNEKESGMKIGIVGYGYLGKAYHKVFPDAVVYDEPNELFIRAGIPFTIGDHAEGISCTLKFARDSINECDMVVVAVPTDPLEDGSLSMGIVEEVIDWIEAPLILIKSALMPGTVDRLIEKTGKKIAVSVEYIGMGNYYVDPHDYPDPLDPQKHKLLVVGGETATAEACASILWSKMSPDVRIHLVSAKEAEICKLLENAYGALKVTWANSIYDFITQSGESYIKVHQAWSEDGRVDPMHTRVVPGKRGWKSHCYDKDIAALVAAADKVEAHALSALMQQVININIGHVGKN